MKTKTTIIILAVLILVAGASWLIYKDLSNKEPQAQEAENTASTTESNSQAEQIAENEAYQALANEIISHPIAFGKDVSEADKQRYTKKINEIKESIRKNFDYDLVWLDLGNYLKAAGDYNGAIEAFNFVGKIRPESYVCFHNLGDLYGFYLKNYPKAEESFLKAIKNEPASADSYVLLTQVYYSYEAGKAKIEPLLLKGIKSNPTNASLKIMLGEYYNREGNNVEALKYFEEAFKSDPTNTALKEDIEKLKALIGL
ncbi:MAG: hypothetical protein PHN74_01605 [Candidatus Pacebacteria bacterium]|nr:hypothetical protein [Candidatus Paceibacterota bacterium]